MKVDFKMINVVFEDVLEDFSVSFSSECILNDDPKGLNNII